MLQVLVIVISTLFTFFSVAHADQCPRLEGRYTCPARNGHPAFDLVITQVGNVKNTVQYSWSYDGGARFVSYQASTRGVLNLPSTYGLCRNKILYLSDNLADLSDSNRNIVNGVGDYIVTTFLGQPVLTCKAIARQGLN